MGVSVVKRTQMLTISVVALSVVVVVLLVMMAMRGPDIDYFATAGQPSQTMGMLLARALASAGYNGPEITLKTSVYVPCATAMIHGGERYILYNPRTISLTDKAGFKTIAQIAILAREVGHLQNCASEISDPAGAVKHSALAGDDAADEYCGYVLARLSTSASDFVGVQRLMLTVAGTPDEGELDRRIDALVNGWSRGGGLSPQDLRARLASRLKDDLPGFSSWW